MSENQKYTNSLIDSTSPYLLQPAHNPVDWYQWSKEALEELNKLKGDVEEKLNSLEV